MSPEDGEADMQPDPLHEIHEMLGIPDPRPAWLRF